MSVTTKIAEGYAFVIPVEMRKSLDLVPGDSLQGEIEGGSSLSARKKVTLNGIWRMISFGGDAVTDNKRIPSDEGRAIVISHSSSDVV